LSQQLEFFRLDRYAFLLDHSPDDAGLALGGQLVHGDGDMRLFALTYSGHPVCLRIVRCPSSGTHHALIVPPSFTTCAAARHWTFGDKAITFLEET
jgi:hypothetical protein